VKNLAKRKRIVSLRNQGKTFIEIAEIFGNCPYRVSGLYAEHMENLNECSKYPFRKYLSVRLRNALVHAFGVEILGKPEKMAEFGSGKLRSLKHFGKITVVPPLLIGNLAIQQTLQCGWVEEEIFPVTP